MTDTKLQAVVQATLRRRGDRLVGEIPPFRKTGKPSVQAFARDKWDEGVKFHFDTMADGDVVDVEVITDYAADGKKTVRLFGVATLPKGDSDPKRRAAVNNSGGFVNPYTFVPTPPRAGLAGTGLGDGKPPSHARHCDGQYTGTLSITLTTKTPLLLPVPARDQEPGKPKLFDVRVGPDGRPEIHGATLKGALRSAYEAITASRYGVFDHDERLPYRASANDALSLVPARVYERANGDKYFRLCQADDEWHSRSEPENRVQEAAWVPRTVAICHCAGSGGSARAH